MRGFHERFGRIVRIGFDPEQQRFVEVVVCDVCPADAPLEQQARTMATVRQFKPAKRPAQPGPRAARLVARAGGA